MQRQNVVIETAASINIVIQLACDFLLAGGAGLLMFYWLERSGLALPLVVTLALVSSVGTGLLATANIAYGAFLLQLALTRLAEGRSTSLPYSFWLWPLHALFRSFARMKLRIDEIFQRERLVNQYREQLLQQASEAAAIEERNHLARDLHDSIKQQIFSIRMSAVAASAHVQAGATKAQEALADILRSANEAQVEMQALLQQLRSAPLEHTSLAEAIRTQAQALEYRSGAQVSVEMADLPTIDCFPSRWQEVLFRIVQEAFANIARHARAQHVYYRQASDAKTLTVTIQDDGQGFDTETAHKGMGLTNIQERVRGLDGTLTIESAPGKGTTLHIGIPLLLPSATKQQQEQEEYEIQRKIEQAQGGLHLRTIITTFTMVALITDLGLFALNTSQAMRGFFSIIIGLCFVLMLYGLASARLAIMQLKHYRDAKDQDLDRRLHALSLQEHIGWTGFFRLFLLASWQIMVWELPLQWSITWWKGGLLFLLLVGSVATVLLVEHQQTRQAQDRYYPLLSVKLLAWEMRYRERNLQLRIIFCICLAIALFVNHSLPFFIPLVLGQWLRDYLLLSFCLFCIDIMITLRQLQPWQKMAKTADYKSA